MSPDRKDVSKALCWSTAWRPWSFPCGQVVDLKTAQSKDSHRVSLYPMKTTLSTSPPSPPPRKHGSNPARILGYSVFAPPHNMRSQDQAKQIALQPSPTRIVHVSWVRRGGAAECVPSLISRSCAARHNLSFPNFYFMSYTQVLLQ